MGKRLNKYRWDDEPSQTPKQPWATSEFNSTHKRMTPTGRFSTTNRSTPNIRTTPNDSRLAQSETAIAPKPQSLTPEIDGKVRVYFYIHETCFEFF